MGASNFGRANASKNFEVLMGYYIKYSECNECGEKDFEEETKQTCCCGSVDIKQDEEYTQPEQWECDELREEVRNRLNELSNFREDSSRGGDDINLGKVFISKNYGDVEITATLECFMEVGYHEGGRLDWDFNYEVGGQGENDEDIDLATIEDDFSYSSDLSVGLQKILSKKALKWVESSKEELIKLVEEVYETFV